jgi:hypothetical protein
MRDEYDFKGLSTTFWKRHFMTKSEHQHREEFPDFTEASYESLLLMAKDRYRFITYADGLLAEPRTILWRHDIDISVHRALKLAQIEAGAGVIATYFVYPRSAYYNMLSSEITKLIKQILTLGHRLALHLELPSGQTSISFDELTAVAAREGQILADQFGCKPDAISFHNFGILDQDCLRDDLISGMVNAYGHSIKARYTYLSDSNGVWRFKRLGNVLEEAIEERLQVLTHPEWWTPEVMPPRARLQRAIDGYATVMGRWYDDLTALHNRPNIWK